MVGGSRTIGSHARGPRFPGGFLWGAATAAYQVEGATSKHGRGESIWDRFCATEGRVRAGDSAAIACDFYHRYPDDIQLMKELGLDAFRFSIAWPRVVPEGRGRVNAAGLDFYDRLVDELLAAGIRPFPTLYHWDLPQALEDGGGWTARVTAEAYVEYVQRVASRLGDRVRHWITHNEPWAGAWLGYGHGWLAPGRANTRDALTAAHHLLLSHGWAAEQIRREAPEARVGIALNLAHVDAASEAEADLEAARVVDGRLNRWFLDPILGDGYPADTTEHFAPEAPPIDDGDLAAIAAPLDFVGVNYYTRYVVDERAVTEPLSSVRVPGASYTDMGWEVHPRGLRCVLQRLQADYDPPEIYILENGAAYSDVADPSGEVRDPERCAYLSAHIAVIHEAIEQGIPVRGYFVWSLLDNFEWAEGYRRRFGLVYIHYPTQERIPKASYHWYRRHIAAQRYATAGDAGQMRATSRWG